MIKPEIQAAKKGDRDAFIRLIKHLEPYLFQTTKMILKHDEDTADALQETILKASPSIRKLKYVEYFKTWILQILIIECNTLIAKRSKVVSVDYIGEQVTTSSQNQKIELLHQFNGDEKKKIQYESIQKEKENTYEMSTHIRQKLDKTYQMIQDMPLKKSKNKGMTVATASVLRGIGTFCSGFVSQTMAEGIKKVPLVGKVFQSLEQDRGLQQASQKGWIQAVQSESAFQNLKLNVSESIFDGTRVAMVVNVEGLNIQDGQVVVGNKRKKLTNIIENIFVEVDGKPFMQGGSIDIVSKQYPNSIILQLSGANERETMNRAEYMKLPSEFQAKLKIQFEGVNHVFELNVPIQKTVSNVIQMEPKTQKEKEDRTFTVSKVTVTPVTTHVVASFSEKDFQCDMKK